MDDPAAASVDRIKRLCAAYGTAVVEDNLVCPSCILGAESSKLPKAVAEAVDDFFARILSWTAETLLTTAGDIAKSELTTSHIISSLQRAMLLALVTKKPIMFTETEAYIFAQVLRQGRFGSCDDNTEALRQSASR